MGYIPSTASNHATSETPIARAAPLLTLALSLLIGLMGRDAAEPARLVPDAELLWRTPRADHVEVRGISVPLDARGLREGAGPAGAPRVLVLGDEEVLGLGRPVDRTLPGQLAARLAEAGAPAEVLNGAAPGYATGQLLALARQRGFALDPALLLVVPGASDAAPVGRSDADLAACLQGPVGRVRLLLSPPEATGSPEALREALAARCGPPGPPRPRLGPEELASALDALFIEAARRGAGVLVLLPDLDGLAAHFDAARRVATRRDVPALDLAAINRSARARGAGARAEDGQPSDRSLAAAAQATVDVLLARGWPGQVPTPALTTPPYVAKNISPGE